ncbi:MAG: hypothetical protein ACAH17_03235 [Candidatus Paceibacterota bacterium]
MKTTHRLGIACAFALAACIASAGPPNEIASISSSSGFAKSNVIKIDKTAANDLGAGDNIMLAGVAPQSAVGGMYALVLGEKISPLGLKESWVAEQPRLASPKSFVIQHPSSGLGLWNALYYINIGADKHRKLITTSLDHGGATTPRHLAGVS